MITQWLRPLGVISDTDPISLVWPSHGVMCLQPSLCLGLQSAMCVIALLIQMMISGQYFVIITWVLSLLTQAHCVICSVIITRICWLIGFMLILMNVLCLTHSFIAPTARIVSVHLLFFFCPFHTFTFVLGTVHLSVIGTYDSAQFSPSFHPFTFVLQLCTWVWLAPRMVHNYHPVSFEVCLWW